MNYFRHDSHVGKSPRPFRPRKRFYTRVSAEICHHEKNVIIDGLTNRKLVLIESAREAKHMVQLLNRTLG